MSHEVWAASDSRAAAYERQGGLCALCWEPLQRDRFEAHHRLRRKAMPKPYLWCPCDIVALHPRCHTQGPQAVHDHPDAAREVGLILDTNDDPRDVPIIVQWPWDGMGYLGCDSTLVSPMLKEAEDACADG